MDRKAVPAFDDGRFAMDLLETEHVLVVPGSSFNVPYTDHMRFTLLPDEESDDGGASGGWERLLGVWAARSSAPTSPAADRALEVELRYSSPPPAQTDPSSPPTSFLPPRPRWSPASTAPSWTRWLRSSPRDKIVVNWRKT